MFLSSTIPLGSNKYRSANDSSLRDASKTMRRYQCVDTPGHGKLRSEKALQHLTDPTLRGIIFVVDAAALDSGEASGLRDAAGYLHNILLALQRRRTAKSLKGTAPVPVLIAANKQDLFTALPPAVVRDRLQADVEKLRVSRSKGIAAVGEDSEMDPEHDTLGGGGEDSFTFKKFRDDYEIQIDVLGGAVRGEEGPSGVRAWEEWIGGCL